MVCKKVMRFIAISLPILSIVLFLALSIQFDSDPELFDLLSGSGVVSTLHRLSVYYIPGISMIGGLFALVFTTKKILIFMAVVQLLTCVLLKMYIGKSVFMLAMFIVYLILSIVYLISAICYKTKIAKSR